MSEQEQKHRRTAKGEQATVFAALEREMSVLLRRAMRRFWNDDEYADGVLDRWTYALLIRLSDEGPLRVGEVARRFGVDKSTASRHLKKLQDGGLVEAIQDSTDARSALMRLTPRGTARLAEVRTARMEPLRRVFSAWPEQDRQELARLLARLNSDMDQVGEAGRDAPVPPPRP